ncbi:MAG: hypothetical protein A2033_00330 [Bacteroidetes bacterium GWA2_31_9]|nr:MAG: hypothetical protein A2033_00330 [Bacteroidetes bacterium GWA2_31_9]
MKKTLLTIAFINLFFVAAFAQWDTIAKPSEYYFSNYVTTHNNELYCGGGNGVYKYNGTSWDDLTNGTFQSSSNTNVEVIFAGSYIYARTTAMGIYRSSDNGNTWEMDTVGLPQMSAYTNEPWSMFYDGTTLFVSFGYYGYNFFRKLPSENSWTKINEIGSSSSVVWGVTKQGSNLYAIATDGCWESTDGGQSWTKKTSTNLPQIYAQWHITNAGNTVITHNSALYFGSDNGLFKSTDSGDSWIRVDNGFQDFYNSVGIAALYSDGANLFASTRNTNNAYKSTDNGTTWTDLSAGLDGKISSFTKCNGKLYASIATQKNIYYFNDGSSGINDMSDLINVKLYPNPFSENAVISIDNSEFNNATLNITSVLGNSVKEIKNITGNQILINRENLKSGIYIYNFKESEKIIKTGKFVIK